MEELVDLLVKDDSPSQISDKIKDMLYAKSAEKVDNIKPKAASSLFGNEIDAELQGEVEKAAAVISGEDQTSMRADSNSIDAEVDTESQSEE
jgi:phosphohistidine swiveling domain-containing protein